MKPFPFCGVVQCTRGSSERELDGTPACESLQACQIVKFFAYWAMLTLDLVIKSAYRPVPRGLFPVARGKLDDTRKDGWLRESQVVKVLPSRRAAVLREGR